MSIPDTKTASKATKRPPKKPEKPPVPVYRAEIAARLEEARLARGYNRRADLEEFLRLHSDDSPSISTLGEYERGDSRPNVEYLSLFCQSLRISPTWVMWGIGEMELRELNVSELLVEIIKSILTSDLDEEELQLRLIVALDILRLHPPLVAERLRDLPGFRA